MAHDLKERVERSGAIICPDCPDPGTCAAERECAGRAEASMTDAPGVPEWDDPEGALL
jgi:hypothetical protein